MLPITVFFVVMAAFLLAPSVSAGASYDHLAQYNPDDPRTKHPKTSGPLVIPPSPGPVMTARPRVIKPPRVVVPQVKPPAVPLTRTAPAVRTPPTPMVRNVPPVVSPAAKITTTTPRVTTSSPSATVKNAPLPSNLTPRVVTTPVKPPVVSPSTRVTAPTPRVTITPPPATVKSITPPSASVRTTVPNTATNKPAPVAVKPLPTKTPSSTTATGTKTGGMDGLKRYGDALVNGMYDPKGSIGTPRNTTVTPDKGAATSNTRPTTGGTGHTHSGTGTTSTPTNTASHTHGTGSRHSGQYTSAGYYGDDKHLRPTRIPGLNLQSRGTPIDTYLIHPDPRVGNQNALAWWGASTILIDGAQHVIDLNKESDGLDTWKSANILTRDGKPDYNIDSYDKDKLDKDGLPEVSIKIARDPNDPNKWIPLKGPDGYPISKTALQYKGQYVDSSQVPGIAINQELIKNHNVKLGDPVYVYNTENGRGSWGIVMDVKGKDKKENTEVNVKMASQLGINNDPRNGGTTSQNLIYTVYPGAGKGKDTKPEDWQPNAIKNSGETAAWNNGFDPSKTQWHLPQPQQPTTAATPPKAPAKKPPAPVKKTPPPAKQPEPSADEMPLPDQYFMSK
jgi:hypothetical protein